MHTLYKLNFSSGKSYIGQTVRNMSTRFSQHRQSALRGSSQLPVHCAWRKYGEPSIEILGSFLTVEDLHNAEIDAIKRHCTLSPDGYNVSHGGDTAPSKTPSVARKISEKATGRKHNADALMSIGASSRANWQSAEYREKVSAGLRSCWTDDRRAEASNRLKSFWEKRKADGWEVKDSTKEKLRARVFSEETRKRMSDSAKSRKRGKSNEETRSKMASSAAESWRDPAIKARRSEAIRLALKHKYENMTEAERTELKEKRKRAAETRKLKAHKVQED